MKTTGRASDYDEVEQDPSIPFIKDIKKDMISIKSHYDDATSIIIKKKMIREILNTIN
tara:strand:- start:5781 stop:5954 length:174 start_codon:yes stop_codon:yes gene_type:complete